MWISEANKICHNTSSVEKNSVSWRQKKGEKAWVKSFTDLCMLMAKTHNLIFSIFCNIYAKGVSQLSSWLVKSVFYSYINIVSWSLCCTSLGRSQQSWLSLSLNLVDCWKFLARNMIPIEKDYRETVSASVSLMPYPVT